MTAADEELKTQRATLDKWIEVIIASLEKPDELDAWSVLGGDLTFLERGVIQVATWDTFGRWRARMRIDRSPIRLPFAQRARLDSAIRTNAKLRKVRLLTNINEVKLWDSMGRGNAK